MSVFQKIREWAGIKSVDVDDNQPIDVLEKADLDLDIMQEELEKAQSEYDEASESLDLKIEACNKLIEKGSSEGEYNKVVLTKRLDKITNEFFQKATDLSSKIKAKDGERGALEVEILTKSIELTSMLPANEQDQISDIMTAWESTGLIKGEEIDNQIRAIVTAINTVVQSDTLFTEHEHGEEMNKGSEGSRGGHVIGHTKSGKPIYNSFNHDSHKDFKKKDHEDAAKIHSNEARGNAIALGSDSEKYDYHIGESNKHYHAAQSMDKDGLKKSEDEFVLEKAESYEGHYANVIVRRGNKILFLKRAKDKTIAPGQYCLPGGHIDAGESIQQAAVRELKEEANLDCDADCLHIVGKGKCDDGKWAFYLNSYASGEVALLDGESQNAAWMTKEEWMDADLFFDLKDHLINMEYPEFDIAKIPTLSKADEADFFFEELEKASSGDTEFEKAWGGHEAAQIGEHRTWGGVKYTKVSKDKWKPDKKDHRLPVAEVSAHAENTSGGQLKKVANLHPDNHLRDAAKREIERRKTDKEKAKPKEAVAVSTKVEATSVKKKQKPVKYKPNEFLVDPNHKRIEKEFGKKLNKGFEFARGQYQAQFGNVLNTDNARELSDDYKKDRSLSMAVHEPASALIKKFYSMLLKEPTPKGKQNKVLFSAGGTGVGKSTGINEHGATKKEATKAHIVYDTNMNGFAGAKDKIDRALAVGKRVSIVHTFREPFDAFVNGAIPRAIRMEKEMGSGRTVPIGSHVNTHIGSNEAIPKLKEHYKDNPNVKIRVIDNSRGKGNSAMVPIEFLQGKTYIAEDLKKQLHEHIDKLHEQGKISESLYRGFKAEGD